MPIFPQIRFDKITLTGGSKPIVVNDPHIDTTDGPLLLREGVFKTKNNFYDINIQLSTFENGSEVGPANWLKNIEYLKYIKIAVFVSFYENDLNGPIPQNYTTSDILGLETEKEKREITNLIIYDTIGLSKLPYNINTIPEQYELFSFNKLISKPEDYIKYQTDDGDYIIPLNLTLKFPRQTNHLQIFAIPFLDLEALAFDYKIDIRGTIQLKDVLEEPFFYSLNVIKDGKSQDSDIIINNIITDDVSKINLKLPKDDILPTLNLDKNKVFNSTCISNLYYTKNELNQDILFFFINRDDLIIKNSPFYASFVNKTVTQTIKDSILNSRIRVSLLNDKKIISKSNNKLGNKVLSTKSINNMTDKKQQTLSVIPNFINNIDLYYSIIDETKENNIVNSYELEIFIQDNIMETLLSYYNILNSNLSQIKSYLKIVEIPYVKERTFLIDEPHIDVLSTKGEISIPAFGFYDLPSNMIKNIDLLQQQVANQNTISKGMFYTPVANNKPIDLFASKIENDLLNSLSFIIPLFSLDETIVQDLKVLNLIKPETASIQTLNTIISIHKDILDSIGKVLDLFGVFPRVSDSKSGGKKRAITKYTYEFKQAVVDKNYFNNFKFNNFSALNVTNDPYPTLDIQNAPVGNFLPQKIKLFGNQFNTNNIANTPINTDFGRIISYYYQLINNEVEMAQDIYSIPNKEQKEKESYSSFASLLLNNEGSDMVYTIANNLESKGKIDSFSYNFIFSSKEEEKKEKNNINLLDKSTVLINELEEKIQSNENSKISKQKTIAKKSVSKTFNVKASDVSDGIDKFITQLIVSPTSNLDNNSLSNILPIFRIEALVGFENGNLSLPIWQSLSDAKLQQTTIFCRLLTDFSQVSNTQLINKALNKLEYPNKYFIIGRQNA